MIGVSEWFFDINEIYIDEKSAVFRNAVGKEREEAAKTAYDIESNTDPSTIFHAIQNAYLDNSWQKKSYLIHSTRGV